MTVSVLTGTDGIVVLPGTVDSNSFIKLSFPFCGSDILYTYVFLYSRTEYTSKYNHTSGSRTTIAKLKTQQTPNSQQKTILPPLTPLTTNRTNSVQLSVTTSHSCQLSRREFTNGHNSPRPFI